MLVLVKIGVGGGKLRWGGVGKLNYGEKIKLRWKMARTGVLMSKMDEIRPEYTAGRFEMFNCTVSDVLHAQL